MISLDSAMPTINSIVVCWMVICAAFAAWQIMAGRQALVSFVIVVHFFLCGLPLFWDTVIGQPEYTHYPAFSLSSRDAETALLYGIYMSMTPLLLWGFGRASPRGRRQAWDEMDNAASIRTFGPILIALMLSPALIIALLPSPRSVLTFGPALRHLGEDNGHYQFLAASTVLAVFAAATFTSLTSRTVLVAGALMPWIGFCVFINGKRYLSVMALLLFGYIAWSKGYLRGIRAITAGIVFSTVLFGFSLYYQHEGRHISVATEGLWGMYENFRIDYGRDSVIKMTLFAELHPDELRILEYRGQSILFDLTMPVPRQWWPGKPLPYAQYVTSALFFAPPKLWGWGMTTSWLEEAVANASWAGLLLGPLLIAFVCRIGESLLPPFGRALTVLLASLLLSVQLSAYAVLFAAWVGLLVCYRRAPRVSTERMKHESRLHSFG